MIAENPAYPFLCVDDDAAPTTVQALGALDDMLRENPAAAVDAIKQFDCVDEVIGAASLHSTLHSNNYSYDTRLTGALADTFATGRDFLCALYDSNGKRIDKKLLPQHFHKRPRQRIASFLMYATALGEQQES